MIAADRAVQRASESKLLHVDSSGRIEQAPRSALIDFLAPGDLVVANDAATLPASLQGQHVPTGAPVEVRLAGRASLGPEDIERFDAVVFGAGDYRTRTEDRPAPPLLAPGQRLQLGPVSARIERVLDHPRLIALRFEAAPPEIWRALAVHGRPIQYAHMQQPLQLWDVWTTIAGPPVAYEPPSAGFALDWQLLAGFAAKGIEFATLTHAAGISSTGDAALDRLLPLHEPYRIPAATAAAVHRAAREERRVIAVGTTVVRALEHSAARFGVVLPGSAVADQRIDASSRLVVVDALLSGTHEPGTSHYELLHAFAAADVLRRADQVLNAAQFRTHEFGDSVLIERARHEYSRAVPMRQAQVGAREKARAGSAGGGTYTARFLRAGAANVVQESGRLPPSGRLVEQRS